MYQEQQNICLSFQNKKLKLKFGFYIIKSKGFKVSLKDLMNG